MIISTGRKKTPYADNPETAFPGIVVLSETSIPNTGVVSLILDICRRLADVHASSEELLSNSSKADVEHWSEKRKLGVSHKDVPPHDFNNFIQLNLKGKKPIIFERREVYKTSLITLMRTLRALGLNAKVSMNPVD